MRPTKPHEALATLQEAAESGDLGELCAEHGIVLLVAHGSAADPERADDAADLDLAVRFDRDADVDLLAVYDAFLEWLGVERVDLLDLARADVVARQRALVGSVVPLYEAERGAYAEEQIAAQLEYMDTEWLRRLRWDLLEAGPEAGS